jgi:hypothetical protein
MVQGLSNWESSMSSDTHTTKAHFRGTVLAADCALVQAFREQSNVIGWEHFLRGRIAPKE